MSSPPAEDRLFLRGLEVECIIGFIDWERRIRQTVIIALAFRADCAIAGPRESIADTTDYKRIAKRVLAFVGESQFHLVETLAERLAALLLQEFALAWVRLTINKPGAIRHARDVGVVIERRR